MPVPAAPGSRAAAPGLRGAGGSRVRPVAGALLVVAVCALVLAEGRVRAGSREPVLALGRPVAAGQVITPSDLRVAGVSGPDRCRGTGLPAGPGGGPHRGGWAAAGSLLAAGDVGAPSPGRGQARLGVALMPGRYPPGLSPGQRVGVLAAPLRQRRPRARAGGRDAVVLSVTAPDRARQQRWWSNLTCRGIGAAGRRRRAAGQVSLAVIPAGR